MLASIIPKLIINQHQFISFINDHHHILLLEPHIFMVISPELIKKPIISQLYHKKYPHMEVS